MSWPEPATFLSGEHGYVRRRARAVRRLGDRLLDAWLIASGALKGIDRLVATAPPRDVAVLSVYRGGGERLMGQVASARHRVRLAFGAIGDTAPGLAEHTVASGLNGGKFPNLNVLLTHVDEQDWVVVVDDDVALPKRFLDRFLALCEHFELALAQPAQTLASHAAWPHVRRRPRSLVRETRLVEIGPVTAFRRDVLAELAPFPELRYGWGLDLVWSALALERGWRLGIADAVPVAHEDAGVASAYSSQAAIAEAREFLADRAYVAAASAGETVAVHRTL